VVSSNDTTFFHSISKLCRSPKLQELFQGIHNMTLDNYADEVHQPSSARNRHAASRWKVIFNTLAPVLNRAIASLPGEHVPCPLADRVDAHPNGDARPSFRFTDLSIGAAICSCRGWPNGFELLQDLYGWSRQQAEEAVNSVVSGNALPLSSSSTPPAPDNQQRAIDLWKASQPDDGTIARYFQSRGLSGAVPLSVKLHNGGEYPVAVCSITKSDGSVSGVHRIALARDGKGKAPVPTPKTSLGTMLGGAVRLGGSEYETICVTEGVETGLAVQEAIPGVNVWACLTGNNLAKIAIPETVSNVVIFSDNDANQAGQKAAAKLADRVVDSGKAAYVLTPDEVGLDWLDVFVKDRGQLGSAFSSAKPWQSATSKPAMSFELMTAAEFAAKDVQVDYLIPSVLVAGEPCIVGGASKSLKTSIAVMDLSLSLATGKPFLNHFTITKPARVIVFSGESGLSSLKNTAERVAASKGVSLSGVPNWLISTELPDLTSVDHLNRLEQIIVQTESDVVFIDPTYLAMPVNSSESASMFTMGAILRQLSEIAVRTGCTPLVIHHFRESLRHERRPPDLSDLSHAGFAQWARQFILIGRRQAYQDDGNHALWMRCGGSAGHTGLWGVTVIEGLQEDDGGRIWLPTISSASEVKKSKAAEVQLARQQQASTTLLNHICRLLDVLKANPEGDTRSQLKEMANLNSGYFATSFAAIERAGIIEPVKIKKGSGQEYAAYRLITQHQGTPTQALGQSVVTAGNTHSDAGAINRPPPASECDTSPPSP